VVVVVVVVTVTIFDLGEQEATNPAATTAQQADDKKHFFITIKFNRLQNKHKNPKNENKIKKQHLSEPSCPRVIQTRAPSAPQSSDPQNR
jgi:hypothetical protein